MSGQKRFTRYIGVAISILGLAVIALGVFFVTAELAAKSEVQAAMSEERFCQNSALIPENSQHSPSQKP